jgi:uncharacterized phiE125 gp8 family phage protein
MKLRRTVDAAGPAVPTTSVLEHLRVGNDPDDLLHISGLIGAATRTVENMLGIALITQGWELTLDAWPDCGPIILRRPPIISITEVRYISTAGVSTVLAPAMYFLDAAASPARLAPSFGNLWPETREQMAAIKITFQAGYGSSWNDVPESARLAIMLLVAHWYENREAVNVGNIVTPLPFAVDALLDECRTRLYE